VAQNTGPCVCPGRRKGNQMAGFGERIAFGDQPAQEIPVETAAALLRAFYAAAPGAFGYYLALAVTGVAPSVPRTRTAPDRHQGEAAGHE
jgi:hypothetical protein